MQVLKRVVRKPRMDRDEKGRPLPGYSPGEVGIILGMSDKAIMAEIKAGRLKTDLLQADRSDLHARSISQKALDAYRASRAPKVARNPTFTPSEAVLEASPDRHRGEA